MLQHNITPHEIHISILLVSPKTIHNALFSSFTLTHYLPFSPCTITHETPAVCLYYTDFLNVFFVSNTIKLARIMFSGCWKCYI